MTRLGLARRRAVRHLRTAPEASPKDPMARNHPALPSERPDYPSPRILRPPLPNPETTAAPPHRSTATTGPKSRDSSPSFCTSRLVCASLLRGFGDEVPKRNHPRCAIRISTDRSSHVLPRFGTRLLLALEAQFC